MTTSFGYLSPGVTGGGGTGPATSVLSGAIGSGTINSQFQVLSGSIVGRNIAAGEIVSGGIAAASILPPMIADGSILSGNHASGQIHPYKLAANSFVPIDYALIIDQKALNTAGGGFTAGSWVTRNINTEIVDTGSDVTVAGNQLTISDGNYRIRATVPAYNVLLHKAKLFEVSGIGDVLIGTSEYANLNQTHSLIDGRFLVSGGPRIYEIRHYCSSTQVTNGAGFASNFSGYVEVYTTVELWREGP